MMTNVMFCFSHFDLQSLCIHQCPIKKNKRLFHVVRRW